jgi:hypothetical protein
MEVRVTHDSRGRVTSLEIVHGSGHERVDDEVREVLTRAIADEEGQVPDRVAHGKPFASHWLVECTWFVTPPQMAATSLGGGPGLMVGTSFDIDKHGVHVDSPTDVKFRARADLLDVTPL